LLPEVHSSVEWHDYKTYLVQYLEKNAEKVSTGKEALGAVVSGVSSSLSRVWITGLNFSPQWIIPWDKIIG
jgi:hypothetical protein